MAGKETMLYDDSSGKNKLRLEKRVSNRRKAKKWVIFCFQGLEEILKLVDLAHKVNWF